LISRLKWPTKGHHLTDGERTERRLAAVLAADVAGYSRLMGLDEEGTLARLKSIRKALVEPAIASHRGRIVKTTGDGMLVEFSSAVDAVRGAVEVQRSMADQNAPVPQDQRIEFRIGIHVGDIIIDDNDIFGDGVNIAARLEGIAESGGVCMSDDTYRQIRGKVEIVCEDLGPQTLKNIAEPMRAWRLRIDAKSSALPSPKPSIETAQRLALPDKPSIAVLPFQNMSGDPAQEYFSDGITEDIITELSRFSELFVIARNSSFTYKGRAVDVRQVGRELGVRYVLEGSIRRGGDRVRITAQLIDAVGGAHRWAERYDRELRDIFALQDEVARTIVAILAVQVNKAEIERSLLKPPATWQAYDYYMQAASVITIYLSLFRGDEIYQARRLLEQSLAIDPNYARSWAQLSWTHLTAWLNPLDGDFLKPAVAEQFARRATRLDPNLPQAHAALGYVIVRKREYDEAIAGFQKAAALNPNFTDWRFGGVLVLAGEPQRAIEVLVAHMRLDPFYIPLAPQWLGLAYYTVKQYSDAVAQLRECVSRTPNLAGGHAWLAATYAQLGQLEDARSEATKVLRINPRYSIRGSQMLTTPFKCAEQAEHLSDGLRKAGLPER
jgi:adenylate cyclase